MARTFETLLVIGLFLGSCKGGAGAAQTPDETSPQAGSGTEPAPAPPPVWPRSFTKAKSTVLLYQPQVDAWKDHAKIRFRAAVAVTPSGGKTHYGVLAVEADTLIDENARTVLMTNMDVAARFPGIPDAQAEPLKALVKELLPGMNYLDVSLDHVLADMHGTTEVKKVDGLNLQPPPIFFSDAPAILVIYLGQPQFKPVPDTQLMFAVNTNWVVLMDTTSSQYYLLDGDSWLTSPDPLAGPWTAAATLPDTITTGLPASGNWADVRKHIPGTQPTQVPRVITSIDPAELIVTNGPAEYTPIAGTRLMYVSNPVLPVFLDLIDNTTYYLASGRWFSAQSLEGPWSAASTTLPAEFAKIPESSPMAFVLASVPGTQEAQDAALLATVPHKATINIATATVTVTYEGTPKFVTIQGTAMTYAVNTPYQVLAVDGRYYCCYLGVWFTAASSGGPWAVCTSVPAVIYTIPPSSPLYNVTYVQVYSSTPTTVVVGYTAGYSGEYVAATGALMFGAGMLTGALLASNNCWYGCPPCYYSYGCCAHYSYGYGCYYRGGGSYYGPHGGCGWGATYNPSTGTYARGGYAYGPDGAHWGAQAYNPYTNTYGAHAGGTNGYKSWGSSYVQQGSKWAEAGHQSGALGSTGWAENSSGQWAEGARGAGGNAVATTSAGNTFAAHDGNVYKNSGDGWQKYSGNGNWEDSGWNKPAQASSGTNSWDSNWRSGSQDSNWKSSFEGGSTGDGWGSQSGLNQDAWSRNQGSSNAASSWSQRSGGGGLFGGGGGHSWGGGGGWGGRSFGGGGFGGGGRFGGFRR